MQNILVPLTDCFTYFNQIQLVFKLNNLPMEIVCFGLSRLLEIRHNIILLSAFCIDIGHFHLRSNTILVRFCVLLENKILENNQ